MQPGGERENVNVRNWPLQKHSYYCVDMSHMPEPKYWLLQTKGLMYFILFLLLQSNTTSDLCSNSGSIVCGQCRCGDDRYGVSKITE